MTKIQLLIESMSNDIASAFVAAIRAIKSDVDLQTLTAAVEAQDIERIIRVLRMGPEYLGPLEDAIRTAVSSGGTLLVSEVRDLVGGRGARAIGRFDTRNEEAERIVRTRSSRQITDITDRTREAVRVTLAEGMARGSSPRTLALDLVGRTSRTTVGRSGGVIGLNQRQAGWIASAREELSDPSTMSEYLGRGLRDRRFDGTVRRAIERGERLTKAQIDRITGALSDRTLVYRGQTIARTEALHSVHAGRYEGIRQLEADGRINPGSVDSEWDSNEDEDTRDSHAAMEGQRRPHGQPFQTPTGYLLLYPGDGSQGAPASETVQCRCSLRTRIDDITGLRERLLGSL